MPTFFVTGTDTEVGKTIATGLIAKAFLDAGKSVITQKWIQSGLSEYPEDITTHHELMKINKSDYEKYEKPMCPYKLQLPASAHLAAKEEGIQINPDFLITCSTALAKQFDYLFIEGLGGINVPITEDLTSCDVVEQAKYPVIVVIDNKLGAINHALLTIEVLQNRKIPVAGLIINHISKDIDPKIAEDNMRIIERFSHVDILGIIPHGKPYTLIQKNNAFWN